MPVVAQSGSHDARARAATTQVVYSSVHQYWSPRDRRDFQKTFRLPTQGVKEVDSNGVHESIQKCDQHPRSCAEANLDVQYMNAMSPWSKIELYYNKGRRGMGLYAGFITGLLDLEELPHVISISYSIPELYMPREYMRGFNKIMATMGLRGATVVAASGDDGAHAGGKCSMGKQVGWPVASPYVTSVGATIGVEVGLPEVAMSTHSNSQQARRGRTPLITSGGGYSAYQPVPSWQQGHVPWNAPGRGVPDIALAGRCYAVRIGGMWHAADGTSASAPTFAGMISLINAERKAKGEPLVGFLNPSLYANAGAFNDVTEGSNRCGRYKAPCCGGYSAGKGWDPVTGLGSPNFGKLLQALSGGSGSANKQPDQRRRYHSPSWGWSSLHRRRR